ncbi:MAG TPA: hypothetical protein VK750_07345 [Cytophagaceae bacterium]|jgi:hypothetical protein|nr:hypothetical protein [Cytophagaceae bacterium]
MSHKEDGLQKFKTVVTYSALGLGTATGLFFAVRLFIRQVKKHNAEKNSLKEGHPATLARQINMALHTGYFGWTTNTDAIFSIFRAIPKYSTYRMVGTEYSNMYHKELDADLQKELSSDEYNHVIQILSTKSDAKKYKA